MTRPHVARRGIRVLFSRPMTAARNIDAPQCGLGLLLGLFLLPR